MLLVVVSLSCIDAPINIAVIATMSTVAVDVADYVSVIDVDEIEVPWHQNAL